tara:strand:+ start:168 stop:557 length:390 start_codon:yes stop_codon:yes gene_type:complete
MAIHAMKKKHSEFHCKSCSKKIIDFRDKSCNEIKAESTSETCGIFNEDQVEPQTNYNYYKKFVFKVLMILSLIGFNVSPLSANAYSLNANEKVEIKNEKEKEKSKKEKKKRWNPFRKKKKFPVIGCPSF